MITLSADGTIIEISSPANINSLPELEFYSGMLIPGMVNAHTHLELSYLAGAIPPRSGFAGFAASLRENRGRFSQDDMTRAAAYRDARMWADGVQAAGDVCNGELTLEIKRSSSVAYHSFAELYGLNATDFDVERVEALRDEAQRSGLSASVTPHSTYSLNEEPFRRAVGGDDNTPLSIHFMESPGEAELFGGSGELARWYAGAGFSADFTNKYASPAERIVALVPPERRVMLIHNTFIGDRDIELLKAHFGDRLTFVLCPRSNVYITGQLPPVHKLIEHGVNIALGTDSLASNHSLSIVGEMKALEGVPLVQMLGWATAGGARALGMPENTGALKVGCRPGVALLSGINWSDMTLGPDAATRRIV